MAEHEYDDLARDLAALGRGVDVPAPGAGLAVSVLERLPEAPPARAFAAGVAFPLETAAIRLLQQSAHQANAAWPIRPRISRTLTRPVATTC